MRPASSGGRRRLARTLVAVAALLAVALVDRVGLVGMTDASLRRLHYEIRGPRASDYGVLLVAADEGTLDAWGPPPWSWERLDALLAALLEGDAKLVAALEPGPRLLPREAPPQHGAVARAIAERRLVLPPAGDVPGQPGLEPGAGGLVERVALRSPRDPATRTATAAVLEGAGFGESVGRELVVDFLAPPGGFPVVSAHRVASGEIPADTFRDRIVLIGITAEPYMPRVPTPVGSMAPVEVQANAVLAVADGAVLHAVPRWVSWLAMAAIALGLAWVLPLLAVQTAHTLTAAVVVGSLVVDYGLFAHASLELGACAPALAAMLVAAATGTLERRRAADELAQLDRRLTHRLRVDAAQAPGRPGSDALWRNFVRASHLYVDHASSLLATLAPGGWHLDIDAYAGLEPEDIHEKRRDVRRAPFQRAYLSHRPEWAERVFLEPRLDQRSLFVPLVAFGRPLGFWILNFRSDAIVGPDDLELVQTLASQLSLALERERLTGHASAAPRAPVPEGRVVAGLEGMQRGFARLVHEQAGLVALFERLPVGVLVATLWGEPRLVNGRLKQLLGELGIDSVQQSSMPRILARLTGLPEERAHEIMRRLMHDPAELVLPGGARGADGNGFEVAVSRVSHLELADAMAEEASVPLSHFIVTVSRHGAGTHVLGHGGATPVPRLELPPPASELRDPPPPARPGGLVDVVGVVRSVVDSVERDDDAPARAVLVSLPDGERLVHADRAVLEEALADLLRDEGRDLPARTAHRIDVEETDDAVVVHIADPGTDLSDDHLDSLRSPLAIPPAAGPLVERLRRVKALLESTLGTMEADSRPGLGTVYRISLAKARRPDSASA